MHLSIRCLLLFFVVQIKGENEFYTFALLSDIHIGDTGANALGRARSAVTKINQLAANVSNNLQAVFITGDLTNSAMPSQYETVHQVLNNLTVPYFPIIGNHDQWLYNSTWEDDGPRGDQLFAQIFQTILRQSSIINYPNGTVWNPTHQCQSWFQNYRLRIHNNVKFKKSIKIKIIISISFRFFFHSIGIVDIMPLRLLATKVRCQALIFMILTVEHSNGSKNNSNN